MTNAEQRVIVVPLIRVTPSLSELSYTVPPGLRVNFGDLVKIPFRTKTIDGVVWAEDITPARKVTKEIFDKKNDFSLTPQQIEVAKWLHVETLTPLNIILRSMVPSSHTEAQIRQAEKPKTTIVECATGSARQQVIAKWSQKIANKPVNTLIVAPNNSVITQWMRTLEELRPLHIIPAQSASAQQRLRNDLCKTNIYLTTHVGLLYPLPRVERVILDLADDEGYFSFDQSPRVDVRSLVATFTKVYRADLLILTRWLSPSVKSTFQGFRPVKIGSQPSATLIDRQNEPAGERGCLPPSYLLEKLQNTRTLWLHNRTSEAGSYVCFDCGTSVLCPTCSKPLRVKSQAPLTLECVKDNLRIAAPSACLVCKGTRLSARGPGIQQVARTISVTTKTVVATLERNTVQGDLNSALHVVATTAIGSYPDLNFSAVVILQSDSYFSQPGYRSVEQFFSVYALARAALGPNGEFYVVTYKPETPAYALLNDPDSWVEKTLKEREVLHYPPAGTLVILQPRKRVTSPVDKPFTNAVLPEGVTKIQLHNVWLIRTANIHRKGLLAWIQKILDPTWEAIVDPPNLPMD